MTDYGRYEHLKIEKQDKVAVVSLNRPEVLNAFNARMHKEIAWIWPDLQQDEGVYAIVLTGEGRAFSSGGDLDWLEAAHGNFVNIANTFHEAVDIIEQFLRVDKPIVGAINGPAVGLGATLSFLCDITVASENARIGDTHVKAGIVAGDGAITILPLLVGMHRAKEMMLLGKFLTAQDAQEIGLFNEVVPADQLMPRALEVAQELAEGPPWGIRWTKLCLNQWLRLFANLSFNSAMAMESLTMFTQDFGRALKALQEKTKPSFEGD